MKTYNTQKEVNNDIKDGWLIVDDNVTFTFNLKIKASISAHNIDARNICALNIDARDIDAHNIYALNINARDIDANDINAYDINAYDINANDINANDINAGDINAFDIKYYAFCISYSSLMCASIEGERDNSLQLCLDNDIQFK